MITRSDKQRIVALGVLILALFFLILTQGNPPFFLLLPIVCFTLFISWYLYTEIRKDYEEHLKRSVNYIKDEQEAQVWMHRSFVPRARHLAKKELKAIIVASGLLLMSFIFLWSFFVEGFFTAVINTAISFFFFIGFIVYTLYTPKEFNSIFNHFPRQYRRHSKNDWIHAYLLLFPFALAGFFIYSLTTTGEGIIGSIFATITFIFTYSFVFIGIYCLWFLYSEYQKENEEALKKTAKRILREEKD